MKPGDFIRWHPHHCVFDNPADNAPTPVIAVVTNPDGQQRILFRQTHNGYHILAHAQYLEAVHPPKCCGNQATHLARNIAAGTALATLAAIDITWTIIRKLR